MCAFQDYLFEQKQIAFRVVAMYLCKSEGHCKPGAVLGQCETGALLK